MFLHFYIYLHEAMTRICSSNSERTDKNPKLSALFAHKGRRDPLVAVTVSVGFLLIHAFFIQFQIKKEILLKVMDYRWEDWQNKKCSQVVHKGFFILKWQTL